MSLRAELSEQKQELASLKQFLHENSATPTARTSRTSACGFRSSRNLSHLSIQTDSFELVDSPALRSFDFENLDRMLKYYPK
jgi:hypothetical protein